MLDVLIVGHITKDIIEIKGEKFENPGGVVYYSSLTYKKLGLENVGIFTKLKKEDINLLKELEKEGIKLFYKFSKNTTIFRNIYKEDVNERFQYVDSIADRINYEDIKDIEAKIYHFGPLTKGDIELDIFRKVKRENNLVVLDIQGFLRKIENKKIKLEGLEDINFLKYVDILKTNEEEIRVLANIEDLEEAIREIGKYVKELVVTLGSKGSIVYYNKEMFKIPVFESRKLVDVTGCGDVYLASYVFLRYKGFKPRSSGIFASLVAGLKTEKKGIYIPIKIEV